MIQEVIQVNDFRRETCFRKEHIKLSLCEIDGIQRIICYCGGSLFVISNQA